MSMASAYSEVMRGVGASSRVFDLLDRQPLMRLSGGEKLEKLEGNIKFKDLSFAYPTRSDMQVLDNVSFEIPRNTICAVVGASGSGKSTLVNLLLGLYGRYL